MGYMGRRTSFKTYFVILSAAKNPQAANNSKFTSAWILCSAADERAIVILNEANDPRFRRHPTRGFFATLRMTHRLAAAVAMNGFERFIPGSTANRAQRMAGLFRMTEDAP